MKYIHLFNWRLLQLVSVSKILNEKVKKITIKLKTVKNSYDVDATKPVVLGPTFDSFRQSLKSHVFGDRSTW